MKDAPIEHEVKFFPIDIDDMRARLEKAGANIWKPDRLMRRCIFAQRDNPEMTCTYVRVRDEGDKITMSAKLHPTDGKMESQKEYEVKVSDFDTAREILINSGLKQSAFQENKRETWRMPDGTVVELETWPKLPNYLEIEGASNAAVEKAAKTLGLDWSQHIIGSVYRLYMQHFDIKEEEAIKLLADITFDK